MINNDPNGNSVLGDDQELDVELAPGLINEMPPHTSMEFSKPPKAEGYSDYSKQVLHAIATGLGVTYEMLTGDLSQVNFSSARMGWLEFNRNVEQWRKIIIIPQICDAVWDWFIESLSLQSGIDLSPINVQWVAPRREMIDPSKELAAMKLGIRSGLYSLSDMVQTLGKDPMEHFLDIQEDNKLLDKLNLKLDSDSRYVNQAGTQQVTESDNEA